MAASLLIAPECVLATPSAFATAFTTSTTTTYNNIYTPPVISNIQTYSTELIAEMQGGTVLYDQTFTVPYSDPSVSTAALGVAQGLLTGDGAASILGPNLLSNNTSLLSSVSVTGSPIFVSSDAATATTAYVGPQTIYVGANQADPFVLLAGQTDYDTLITSVITQDIPTNTTDTYLTTQVYELIGVPAPSTVPEPDTLSLWGAAVMAFGLVRRRRVVASTSD